jgi:hypothetical protein
VPERARYRKRKEGSVWVFQRHGGEEKAEEEQKQPKVSPPFGLMFRNEQTFSARKRLNMPSEIKLHDI